MNEKKRCTYLMTLVFKMQCQSKSKCIRTFSYNYLKSKEWSHRHFRKRTCYLLFNNGFASECAVPRKKAAGQVTRWLIAWARTVPSPKPPRVKAQRESSGSVWSRKKNIYKSDFNCYLSIILCTYIANSSKKITTSAYNFDLLKYQTLLCTLFTSGLCFKIYCIGHNIFKEIYKIHSCKFLLKKLSSPDNNTIIHHFNSYALPVK